ADRAFRAALAAAKADTVLGWRDETPAGFAQTAAEFFFDRALGGNKDGVHPPQRPFSVEEVLEVMRARGLTSAPAPSLSELVWTPTPSNLILAPTIRDVTIGDPTMAIAQRLT